MLAKSRLVIDASVVVKWFHEEAKTDKALILLEQINSGETTAFVPNLLLYEIANVLVRGIKQPLPEAHEAIDVLVDMPWHIVSPTTALLKDATHLANEHAKLSVYDAVYVTIALHHDAMVITDDSALYQLIGEPLTKIL